MTQNHDVELSNRRFIRGVNIGGWLVLERFIAPYFFALTDCHINGDFRFYPNQINAPPTTSPIYKPIDSSCKPLTPYPIDEWTLTGAFNDKDIARKYLEIHYDNFVTRKDITALRLARVTHVRVPLGHWILGDIAEDEPYVEGGWPYFQRLVNWCREEGIEVWPDIHTVRCFYRTQSIICLRIDTYLLCFYTYMLICYCFRLLEARMASIILVMP
jgi:glucan 1,3-beta-glucosidase